MEKSTFCNNPNPLASLPALLPMAQSADPVALARGVATTVAGLTGDLVVTLSAQGQVLDVALDVALEGAAIGWADGVDPGTRAWVGQAWVDTVSPECRLKAKRMLQELGSCGRAAGREISHRAHDGHPVTRRWTAVRLGEDGPFLALGHDLAHERQLLERLQTTQNQLEQTYWEAKQTRR